jgi:hypothetical protein
MIHLIRDTRLGHYGWAKEAPESETIGKAFRFSNQSVSPRDPCRNILELPPRNKFRADVEKGCASFGVIHLFIVA